MIEIVSPNVSSPEEWDALLAEGWFRAGPLLVRCDLLCIDHRVRGIVNARLPLREHRHRRNHSRILRRARSRFRCAFGPARVDDERRRLYAAMKHRFFGMISTELDPIVLGYGETPIEGRECAIYDGERLVAVSYFDLGRESVVSHIALYDPSYRQYGLGIYTMLEEIEYGITHGARYYYPGYVVPGLSAFDYKASLGVMQYLDAGGRWRRRERMPTRLRIVDRHDRRVRELCDALQNASIAHEERLNPGFALSCMAPAAEEPHEYLAGLVHARLPAGCSGDEVLLIEYLHDRDVFALTRAGVDHDIDLLDDMDSATDLPDHYELRALFRRETLATSDDVAAIVRAAVAALSVGS